ncbi:GntR family transcriptional regulator [Alicyclobacillus dauci]|uniref:GntR family transcriptional regulator n=1 Tax=Alicyclobacillus dauci TaxID=1475485 RepID=A0ABY6Z278_9BACL|nr:GntR family transcriptional regulator [Alicyclobacillus dauci]WAH36931.1 GntR family transcriptional regulator [Alicyclobacillus dauci]
MTEWQLDTSSGVPLYLQMKQNIIQKIITGEWPPGYQLPTVRQLAVDVRINVNTVSRVYAEVERDGYIRTQQGKGTFVRDRGEWAERPGERVALVEKFVTLVVEMAQAQGITRAELLAALQERSQPNDAHEVRRDGE